MREAILLEKRKNRCIAAILSFKEKEIDGFVSDDVAREFRQRLLDEINAYHLTVMDLLGNKINEEFIDMLAEIHSAVVKEE